MTSADPTTLRVRAFQGLQTLPIIAAQRRGFFAQAGLAVALSLTNSSAEQLAMLACGEVELVHTAPDNVVNFDTQPAAFGVDAATAPQVKLLLGGSNGPLSLFAAPDITHAEDLRGRAVGVDNPGSGFALVLRDLLARSGLELGRDYSFTVAGGTGARAAALAAGTLAATIVYPPFDLLLAGKGCQRLTTSTDAYPAYASQALAGVSGWTEAHGERVTRYIAALLAALAWLHTPTERAAVETLLATEPALGLGAEVAPAQAYTAFTDPQVGFGRAATLDEAGLAQVIALRARYGAPNLALGQPRDYCDLRWYLAARTSPPSPLSLWERGSQDNACAAYVRPASTPPVPPSPRGLGGEVVPFAYHPQPPRREWSGMMEPRRPCAQFAEENLTWRQAIARQQRSQRRRIRASQPRRKRRRGSVSKS